MSLICSMTKLLTQFSFMSNYFSPINWFEMPLIGSSYRPPPQKKLTFLSLDFQLRNIASIVKKQKYKRRKCEELNI